MHSTTQLIKEIKTKNYLSFMLKKYRQYKHTLAYFFIGISAALVDLSLFAFLFNVVSWSAVTSTVLSVTTAMLWGFVLNAIFNYKVTNQLFLRFISYATVSSVGLALSASALYVFYNILQFNGDLVKVLSLPPIFLIQYLLNNNISFSKKYFYTDSISNTKSQ